MLGSITWEKMLIFLLFLCSETFGKCHEVAAHGPLSSNLPPSHNNMEHYANKRKGSWILNLQAPWLFSPEAEEKHEGNLLLLIACFFLMGNFYSPTLVLDTYHFCLSKRGVKTYHVVLSRNEILCIWWDGPQLNSTQSMMIIPAMNH